jgi:predicted nucleotidyltransferase
MSERMAFLKENSEAIKAIAARHKGLNIAVFGSVARGEDGPDSDVDFLVTFDKEVSVLDWLLLNEELEQFLKLPVDVISMNGLKLRDVRIREEAILL